MAAGTRAPRAKKTALTKTDSSAAVVNGSIHPPKRKSEESSTQPKTKSRKLDHADAQEKVLPTKKKPAATQKAKEPKFKAILNHPPAKPLDIYVFGDNSQAQLGLGANVQGGSIRRPRLNPNLLRDAVGVVQVSAGGMHCAALTRDNKILTWGVNDLGALGRDTDWDGGYVDIDDKKSDDSDDDESAVNPKEATPTAVDPSAFPPGTTFARVVAGDSITYAITDGGLVYGWGTISASDGSSAFSPTVKIQRRPALIQGLKDITAIATGAYHSLALTSKGGVISWGFGDQRQLGRRIRDSTNFQPPGQVFGLHKGIVDVQSGSYHSFAIHENGTVYAWGLNSFCQTGIDETEGGIDEKDGEDFASITRPTPIEGLTDKSGKVVCVSGGNQHSIAVTDTGACFTWGRIDAFALGLDVKSLPNDEVVRDGQGKARTLKGPVMQISGLDAVCADAGIDHCIAVAKDGKAYGWGFSSSYQTGQGTDEDIERASLIDNTAIRGKKMSWAGCGGHFSVLAGEGD